MEQQGNAANFKGSNQSTILGVSSPKGGAAMGMSKERTIAVATKKRSRSICTMSAQTNRAKFSRTSANLRNKFVFSDFRDMKDVDFEGDNSQLEPFMDGTGGNEPRLPSECMYQACPPINRYTLAELSIRKILNNPKLRHEIVFETKLEFRPKTVTEIDPSKLKSAENYWDRIDKDLVNYGFFKERFEMMCNPSATRISRLVIEIKGIIIDILQDLEHPDLLHSISEIDESLIIQQLRTNEQCQKCRSELSECEIEKAEFLSLVKAKFSEMKDSSVDGGKLAEYLGNFAERNQTIYRVKSKLLQKLFVGLISGSCKDPLGEFKKLGVGMLAHQIHGLLKKVSEVTSHHWSVYGDYYATRK
ncbi:Protein SOK1 [Smittium culicis]|uniref:Protein SOK1 n=1 Tax=Smittium culicis TaxID=133412 RepID=A0A1R1YJM0_9FUNG|nr:Protein SOK1 [Smittium culicis]